jgi:hypothetical protein
VSRGHGYVQRFVLTELDERYAAGDPWTHARTLAEQLEGGTPTRQTCRSVRRALRLLAREGLVETGRSGTPANLAGRLSVVGRIAGGRADEVAARVARRSHTRAARQQLRRSVKQ